MNYLNKFAEFSTVEEGYEKLTKAVELRDEMGGVMYYNMMNDDCCEIANKISAMEGADKKKISEILGEGTHISH